MPDKYSKASNTFKDKNNKQYVLLDKQKVFVGTQDYKKNLKIYQIKDGKFDIKNPRVKSEDFEIHNLLSKFSEIKDKLPEIKIKNNDRIVNPFTGGTITRDKKKKSYKILSYFYKKDGNKLVPLDEPTHLSYKDKAGRRRLTPRDSKKAKELLDDDNLQLFESSIVEKTQIKTLFNGKLKEFKIRPPIEDFVIHPNNQDVIIELFKQNLVPHLQENYQVQITATLRVRGEQFQYYITNGFLDMNYTGDDIKLFIEIVNEIARYENKIFPSEDYTAKLVRFNVLIFPPEASGGCLENAKDRLRLPDPDDPSIILCSYPVKNNNCLIAVLKRASPIFQGSRKGMNTIRKELGIQKDILIHFNEIENKNMADYFKLTIYLEWKGQLYKYGNYEDEVRIKLINDHYYHIMTEKTKQINARECINASRINRTSQDSYVYQPRGNYLARDPLDKSLVVHVDIENWNGQDQFQWSHKDKIMIGGIPDFVKYLQEINTLTTDDVYKKTISWQKPMQKKIIVHCFGGHRLFFKVLREYIDANLTERDEFDRLKYYTSHFNKGENICFILNIGKFIECTDFLTLFNIMGENCTYRILLRDTTLKSSGDVLQDKKELFYLLFEDFYNEFHIHIDRFLTLPALGEESWRNRVNYKEGEEIYLPYEEFFRLIIQAKRGPRNCPLKSYYKSGYCDKIKNAKTNAERIEICKEMIKNKDYMFYLDAMNFYPSVMTKYPYPAGKPRWLKQSEIKETIEIIKRGGRIDKIGFYHITFIPPRNIRTPVLLKHNINGNILYDLNPGDGVYANVIINKAIEHGYKIINIEKAVIWDKTCNTYFTEYMTKIFKMKNSDSPIRQRIAKIMMNSLYGKLLSTGFYSRPKLCKSLEELQIYSANNVITNYEIEGEKIRVYGYPRTTSKKYGSPIHLGCFVMAYAKMFMMEFIGALDPSLKEQTYYYTDNDSLFIEAKYLDKLREKDLLVDEDNKGEMIQMGKGKNDIKDGLCIIEAKFLTLKTYFYTYVSYKGEIKHVIKAAGVKGINSNDDKEQIIKDYFMNMGQLNFENNSGTRTYNAKYWTGMEMIGDEWYSEGYILEQNKTKQNKTKQNKTKQNQTKPKLNIKRQ